MHFKTLKSRKISFDESKITKKAQGMLYFIKIYLPTNFHAYMMNIGRTNYNQKTSLQQYANELLGETC